MQTKRKQEYYLNAMQKALNGASGSFKKSDFIKVTCALI